MYYFLTISAISFIVPIIIAPAILGNAFNAPKNLAIYLGASLLVAGWAWRPFKLKVHPLVTILIVLNLLSLFYTLNPYYTRVACALNISCLVIFTFTEHFLNKDRAKILFIVITASGFLVSCLAWLHAFGVHPIFIWMGNDLIISTIGNGNYLGAYLLVPLFTTASLFLLYPRHRVGIGAVFLFILMALVFSRARASWLAFFIAFPLFAFINLGKSVARKLILYGSLIVSLIAFFVVTFNSHLPVIFQPKFIFDRGSVVTRLTKYYPPAWEMFKDRPLFGSGLWSYRNQVYKYHVKLNKDGKFLEGYEAPKPRRMHCMLEAFVDGGIVAGITLILFLFYCLKRGWSVIREGPREDKFLSAGAFSAMIALLLAGLFFFPFRVQTTLVMTVIMLGTMSGLFRSFSIDKESVV